MGDSRCYCFSPHSRFVFGRQWQDHYYAIRSLGGYLHEKVEPALQETLSGIPAGFSFWETYDKATIHSGEQRRHLELIIATNGLVVGEALFDLVLTHRALVDPVRFLASRFPHTGVSAWPALVSVFDVLLTVMLLLSALGVRKRNDTPR